MQPVSQKIVPTSICKHWSIYWNVFLSVPGKVRNLQQKRLSNGNVELTWDEPFAKGNDVITYLVMYGGLTKKTKERKFVIESETQDQTYHVEVFVKKIPNFTKLK